MKDCSAWGLLWTNTAVRLNRNHFAIATYLYNEQDPRSARHLFFCGPVAQLGERLVRNEEASGSIPLRSTSLFNHFHSAKTPITSQNVTVLSRFQLTDTLAGAPLASRAVTMSIICATARRCDAVTNWA